PFMLLLVLWLMLLLLLLLLELLLQVVHLPRHEFMVELGVDVVRRSAHRPSVRGDRLGVQPERRLRIRRLRCLRKAILGIPDVVRDARRARRIGVGPRHLLEGIHGVGELPLPVERVAEVEVEQRRVGPVDERLVVLAGGVVELAGGVEPARFPRRGVRVEPGDGHRGERDGGERTAGHAPSGTRSPSAVPMPTVYIFTPRSWARLVASLTSPSWLSPSVMRTSASWFPCRPSNASRPASIAAPRFVPPRGMMPTSIASRLSRKAPWSSVSGHGPNALPANATRPSRSPSRF